MQLFLLQWWVITHSNLLILLCFTSLCCVDEGAATSTLSMALKAIAAWSPHLVWLVQTNVSSVGGELSLEQFFNLLKIRLCS